MADVAVNTGSDSPAESMDLTAADLAGFFGNDEGDPDDGADPDDGDEGTADDASGGGTPASDDPRSPFIPRSRFDEVNTERNSLREQWEAVQPWQPVVNQLAQLGFTPEQIAAEVTRLAEQGQPGQPGAGPQAPAVQPAQQDPTEAFHAALYQRGIDPNQLDEQSYLLAQMNWENAQAVQSIQQERQQAAQQAEQARFQQELASVAEQFPAFKDPALRDALIGRFVTTPDGVSLAQCAQQFAGALDVYHRNQLSQAALQQSEQDRQRPSSGGGNPPSPADTPNYAEMTDRDFERSLADGFRASQKSRGR